MNCSTLISLLIASLGRLESKRSSRVSKSFTFTHWHALGRRSFPLSSSSLIVLSSYYSLSRCLLTSRFLLIFCFVGETWFIYPWLISPLSYHFSFYACRSAFSHSIPFYLIIFFKHSPVSCLYIGGLSPINLYFSFVFPS